VLITRWGHSALYSRRTPPRPSAITDIVVSARFSTLSSSMSAADVMPSCGHGNFAPSFYSISRLGVWLVCTKMARTAHPARDSYFGFHRRREAECMLRRLCPPSNHNDRVRPCPSACRPRPSKGDRVGIWQVAFDGRYNGLSPPLSASHLRFPTRHSPASLGQADRPRLDRRRNAVSSDVPDLAPAYSMQAQTRRVARSPAS